MGFLSPLFDLLFPPRCLFCRDTLRNGTDEGGICPVCLAHIPRPDGCCFFCAYPLHEQQRPCPVCSDRIFSFNGACAVHIYRGTLKKTVHRYKYGGCRHLAEPLGKLLARQVRLCNWPALDAVVPVPLHPKRRQARGYDQALLLARVLGDELRLPVHCCLVRKTYTPSQTKLAARERWENVKDVFGTVAGADIPRCALLVDDLMTTGATAHFAARALLQAGSESVYLAVVGR